MEKLLKMLNDRNSASKILLAYADLIVGNENNPEFFQTILDNLRIDPYYKMSDDHRDWVLGEAQTILKQSCDWWLAKGA